MTIIADYLVLASGTSDRHVRAIAEGVLYDIKEMGALPLRRDGNSDAGWIVLDYADTIVHVFHAREREYYDLERLYRGAPVIRPGGPSVDLTLEEDVCYNRNVFRGPHVNMQEGNDKE